MRQILPVGIDPIDPLDVYPVAERPAPADRPWLMVNMIASVDGAIAIDGRSGGLGGPADKAVFRAIRATADWIVVAAGTARAERYGLPRLPDEARTAREERGRPPDPRLAVVTGRFDLDPDLPMLADRRADEPQPVVITGTAAPEARIDQLAGRAEVVVLEDERPAPSRVLAELAKRGAEVVLAEGGPSFNGQLAEAGLIDELCLSVSPLLVGGSSGRIVTGSSLAEVTQLSLAHLLEQDGCLFARYVRDRPQSTRSPGTTSR